MGMRFEIRRKEFAFQDAPALDGISAGYEALTVSDFKPAIEVVGRFRLAFDAALAAAGEAHRLNHSGKMGTRAAVRGFWIGDRPSGVMNQIMPVSYRPRADR